MKSSCRYSATRPKNAKKSKARRLNHIEKCMLLHALFASSEMADSLGIKPGSITRVAAYKTMFMPLCKQNLMLQGHKKAGGQTPASCYFFLSYPNPSGNNSSIGTSSIFDKPANSISVTVLSPLSILEIEPRQIYTASVSNLSAKSFWLSFNRRLARFTFPPIILACPPSMILAMLHLTTSFMMT